jgi:hypothetical protein
MAFILEPEAEITQSVLVGTKGKRGVKAEGSSPACGATAMKVSVWPYG